MKKRQLPKGVFGDMIAKDRAFVPTEPIGLLTPIKASAGGGGYWSWRCVCGEVVYRIARNVRKSAEGGNVPKCGPQCAGPRPEPVAGAAE